MGGGLLGIFFCRGVIENQTSSLASRELGSFCQLATYSCLPARRNNLFIESIERKHSDEHSDQLSRQRTHIQHFHLAQTQIWTLVCPLKSLA